MKRALAGIGVVVLAAGGYAAGDAYDVVPGVLTLQSAADDPVPLPDTTTAAPSVAAPSPPSPVAAPTATDGTPVTSAQVAAALEGPWASKLLPAKKSIVVLDGATGEMLHSSAPDTALTPASTAKVLSAFAVANTIEPGTRFATTVVADGDHAVLVAGGDTVLAPGKGDPDEIVGHAGVGDLAAQVAAKLKKQGRTSVTLDLDTSYAPGPLSVATWDPEYLVQGFTTRIAMLGLSTERSHPPEPAAPDPNQSVLNTLIKELKKRGITAQKGDDVDAPKGAEVLGKVESAPVEDVLGQAMRDSDNGMIESLSRQAAFVAGVPGDEKSVTKFVLDTVEEHGIGVDGAKLADTSGLSDGTAFSTRLLGEVIAAGSTGKNRPMQGVLAHESVSGYNGTLHDRYWVDSNHSAAGKVRAKTGSLPEVSSLAGTVITDSGRLLVFAIITNGDVPDGVWGNRVGIDNVVAALGKL